MRAVWTQRQGGGRSGVMTTAGNLVFQGAAPHGFSAYRADTGQRVWTTDTQAGIAGAPVSYSIDGVQYVAVVAGTSGFFQDYWAPTYARVLVYKLGGTAELPKPAPYKRPVLDPPKNFGSRALLTLGQSKYDAHCASCHGNSGRVSSLFPDLRYASELWSAPAFDAIVIGGALQSQGMVSFRKALTAHDANAIRAYVVELANIAKRSAPRKMFAGMHFCGGPPGAHPAHKTAFSGQPSEATFVPPEFHQ